MSESRRWADYPDRRTARRAAALRLHPDVGGSAEELEIAFAEIDARFGGSATNGTPVEITIHHSKKSNAMRTAKRIYRVAGKKLSRRSNRYITL